MMPFGMLPQMGQQQQMPGMGQPSQSKPPNPLDAITKLFGLPDGFLDGILPFSPYQTLPVQMDRSQSGMNPAPQSQMGPSPFGSQIPPSPMQGMLQQQMGQMGPMGMGGGPPGMGMPGMGGMPGMPPMGGMGGGMGGPPGMPNLQALMSGMGGPGAGMPGMGNQMGFPGGMGMPPMPMNMPPMPMMRNRRRGRR